MQHIFPLFSDEHRCPATELIEEGYQHQWPFATNTQLHLLADSTIWYIDGTFKVVSRPFTQMVSVHAFLKKDSDMKQVPLVFAMMSGKRKEDYVAVFEAISQMLPLRPKVERFVVDYEAGKNAIFIYIIMLCLVIGIRLCMN